MITGRPNGSLVAYINSPLASSMAWAEFYLNYTYGYYKVTSNEGDQFEYLVPFPLEYTGTMKAYWTTDVIVLDPSCSWQSATTTVPVNSTWDVALSESNLSVSLRNDSFGMFLLSSMFSYVSQARFQCQDLPLAWFQFSYATTKVRNSMFLWTVPYFLS